MRTGRKLNAQRGVILDEASFTLGDLDMSALMSQIDRWDRYPATGEDQRYQRLERASIVVLNKVKLDAQLICSLPDLKLVLLAATGTDNVDLQVCREAGITVCNVTDYCTPSVAQHVLSLVLALSTSLLGYAHETSSGAWSQARHFSTLSFPITELDGKTLGLVGYGTLAKGVEKLALGFGMQVVVAQRPGGEPVDGRLEMDQLLEVADVVSLHCPLLPATRHLIDARALRKMKRNAILINTARGAVVDNVALAEALRAGEIGGAGIDVLEQEPPPENHPLLQERLPNLIVTPHVAWASFEARQRVVDKMAENLQCWLQGSPIRVVS